MNPKLDGLGKVDSSLFAGLYDLLRMQTGQAPRETDPAYTDEKQFLGSSYILDRLGLKPEKRLPLSGDAAFDTRYVSNVILNQTGSRYINGTGSDLAQMKYLMDSAAAQQKALRTDLWCVADRRAGCTTDQKPAVVGVSHHQRTDSHGSETVSVSGRYHPS